MKSERDKILAMAQIGGGAKIPAKLGKTSQKVPKFSHAYTNAILNTKFPSKFFVSVHFVSFL
jgi:hypothetical protein